MSAYAQSLEETRNKLHALTNELVELSKTYEPTPPGTLGVECPLIKKARALIAQAQTPADYVVSTTSASMDLIAIRALMDFNTFHYIPTTGATGVQNLAQKCHASPALLTRLLRVLVSSGFIIQNGRGEYSHTHLSLGFKSNEEIASRLLDLFYETGFNKLVRLPEYLATHNKPGSIVQEPSATGDSTRNNIFTWHHDLEGQATSFEIMERSPERMKKFQKGMSVSKDINPYTGFYDFSKLASADPDQPVFVDIGGGHGDAIKAILQAYPEILPSQCVLQDTASVIEYSKSAAGLPAGVRYQAHDFFDRQPVKGAKAYYFRAIAHDLSDDSLQKVLGQVKTAMNEDSRILIADEILPEVGAQGLDAFKDLMMMVIGGKEKTETNFREVIERVGLKVEGVYRAEGKGSYGLVEAKLA
ncbi:O-methyltransferase gsfC [Pseudocercospora fuligena]|uniref:O-methyltransferase gsfC n=1 Tax=Pseudocercospora fuligena TaxID=685502 RepID=A0A8H6VKP7_9PEZI|nr:O-methyltransferase gsfC [Pseudocercospora fuligena]